MPAVTGKSQLRLIPSSWDIDNLSRPLAGHPGVRGVSGHREERRRPSSIGAYMSGAGYRRETMRQKVQKL